MRAGASIARAAKITIVSGYPLTCNPRVVKEADALAASGFDVTVLSAVWNQAVGQAQDRLLRQRRWRCIDVVGRRGGLPGLLHRRAGQLRRRAAIAARRMVGFEHPLLVHQAPGALLRAALATDSDLYSLHLEAALFVGERLLQAGKRVSIDIEDWYSEDLSERERQLRPLTELRRLERRLLNESVFATTTSRAMAGALSAAYACPEPTVVYNAFPAAERDAIDGRQHDRRDLDRLSIVWFSQTIGPSRGLETLAAALHLTRHPVEVHLRGAVDPEYQQQLMGCFPVGAREHVYWHPLCPHAELLSRLAEHDVGLAGEIPSNANKQLTVSNKILQSMQAGLAVAASNTQGQCEIAAQAGGGVAVYAFDQPAELAAILDRWSADRDALATAKREAVAAATGPLAWEQSRARLIDCFRTVLPLPSA